ncbi:Membrane-bound serine protease (ClpP class) [Chitinispirillum alkaliphilum]|nr:Membrane-bound serine protease (ClpP class) [Chitinispirillum alkaliphilum]
MISRLIIPILLQLLGVAIILAEFILPSAGILTVVAIALFGYSIYLVFATVSITAGFIVIAADVILIPILVIIGVKLLEVSPVTLRTSLGKGNGDEKSDDKDEREITVGQEGQTITDLRPAGTALINGKRRDVVSKGEYISKNSTIKVIETSGNRIVVRKQAVIAE